MNKTDSPLKRDIESEFRWDPKVGSTDHRVSVDKGAVMAPRSVGRYSQTWASEYATNRVTALGTAAQDLAVGMLSNRGRMDSNIEAVTQSALKRDVFTPDSITAKVHDGIVTLEGQVKWNFEREAAERTVQYLKGVVSVKNAIMLEPPTSTSQLKAKIHAALQLQATTDTNSIQIDTSGGTVTLTGYASSWQSIEAAVNVARAIPGVTEVVDQVKMNLSWQSIEAAANAAGAAIPLKVSEKLIATDITKPLQKGTVCGDGIFSRTTLV